MIESKEERFMEELKKLCNAYDRNISIVPCLYETHESYMGGRSIVIAPEGAIKEICLTDENDSIKVAL